MRLAKLKANLKEGKLRIASLSGISGTFAI